MRDFERLDIREDERVEVEMPGNATDGFADVPEPEWLLEAARRAQQARNRSTNYRWALRQYGGEARA